MPAAAPERTACLIVVLSFTAVGLLVERSAVRFPRTAVAKPPDRSGLPPTLDGYRTGEDISKGDFHMSWTSGRKRSSLVDLPEIGALDTAEAVAGRASDAASDAADRIADVVDEISEETARRTALLVVVLLLLIGVGAAAWRRRSASVAESSRATNGASASRAAA